MFAAIKVGAFLASRYIRRANKWATILVVFVMMLTFLNLVMVTGILVGLIAGAEGTYKEQYSGDILIDTYPEDRYIERSSFIIDVVEDLPGVKAVTSRYIETGTIEADYQRAATEPNVLPDTAGARFAGINPEQENAVTGIADSVVEGEFLTSRDEGYVVVGGNLIARYLPGDFGIATIEDIRPGEKLRVTVGGQSKEMIVKGIIKGKADPVDARVFFVDRELRNMIGRSDFNVGEIVIRLEDGVNPDVLRDLINQSGIEKHARVRTAGESIGTFLEDIKKTFAMLGNLIGLTSLIVASITVFIVIFITAITRRKFIGILKGIGITGLSIEMSYIMLSVFYAFIGVGIGVLLLTFLIVPYFDAHPIDFPFSDGILVVTPLDTTVRVILLFITTIIAGYVPAKLVVRKNTLDSITGR